MQEEVESDTTPRARGDDSTLELRRWRVGNGSPRHPGRRDDVRPSSTMEGSERGRQRVAGNQQRQGRRLDDLTSQVKERARSENRSTRRKWTSWSTCREVLRAHRVYPLLPRHRLHGRRLLHSFQQLVGRSLRRIIPVRTVSRINRILNRIRLSSLISPLPIPVVVICPMRPLLVIRKLYQLVLVPKILATISPSRRRTLLRATSPLVRNRLNQVNISDRIVEDRRLQVLERMSS